VAATVYRLASPSPLQPETIDFGHVHIGEVVAQPMTLRNEAANDGYSEGLNARVGVTTGSATGGGTVTQLTPGSIDTSSLIVGIDSTTAGAKTGTIAVDFSSDGVGTSELGETPLAGQSWLVTVIGQVNNYANPTIVLLSDTGHLSQDDALNYSLDLGVVLVNQEMVEVELGLTNEAMAPADQLGGMWTLDAPGFTLTGFDPVSGVDPGGAWSGLFVQLDTSSVGDFAGQIVLAPTSDNATTTSLLSEVTIDLTGTVAEALKGDLNYDGGINRDDIGGLVLGLNDPTTYQLRYSQPAHLAGDIDGDGDLDFDDIDDFVAALLASPLDAESNAVPEPSALMLAAIAALATAIVGRRNGLRSTAQLEPPSP
jgi:hypothetical protein